MLCRGTMLNLEKRGEFCRFAVNMENIVSIAELTLNEYQRMAGETASFGKDTQWDAVDYCTLGLTGEAGEVANKVKKVCRDDKKVFTAEKCASIADELGDCMWYIAMCAENLGYSLEDIARMNYVKLQSRQERGVLGGSGDHR